MSGGEGRTARRPIWPGRRLFRSPVVTVICVVCVGCSDQGFRVPAETPGVATRDSSGVEIVEHSIDAVDALPTWTFEPDPTVDIGRVEGPPDQMFTSLGPVARLSDGGVVIVEPRTRELRFFGPDGIGRASGGRTGEGPGEFSGISHLVVGPGDTVFVWDGGLRRVSVFSPTAAFVRTFPLEAPVGLARLLDATPDGGVLAWSGGQSPGMPVDDLPFHHFLAVVRAREGAPPDTLPVLEQAVFVFSGGGWISPLFSESRRTVPAAGGFWYTTAEPGLARYDEQGALTRIVRCDVGDRSVTADEVELEIQGRTEGRPEAEARRIREEVSTRARVERFPAMDRAIEGADGGIWVREYLRPSQRGRTPRWLAFDGDGRLQAWVELPAEWDLRLVEADAVWVVVSDELDVQHLQRHVRGPG